MDMKPSEEDILFDQPLQILNICEYQKNLRVHVMDLHEDFRHFIDNNNMETLFGYFFKKAAIKFNDKTVERIDDIKNYFKNNTLSDQVVFIDFTIGGIRPDQRVDEFARLYEYLRNKCLCSSYIIFYYVDPRYIGDFNKKLMDFSDIDMPGFDLVFMGPSVDREEMYPSLDMMKITFERAFYRSWGWSQIEKLGTRKLEKTIALFDIEKYTDFVNDNIERQLRVTGQLNQFYEKVINIIYDHRGYVNDTKGDEIMAVFDRVTQVENAIEATFKILEALENMKKGIHIGIETGIVIEGSLGTTRFNKLTQIGEVVNIASRICSPKEDSDEKLEANCVHIGEKSFKRLEEYHKRYLGTNVYSISDPRKITCGQTPVKVYTISKK